MILSPIKKLGLTGIFYPIHPSLRSSVLTNHQVEHCFLFIRESIKMAVLAGLNPRRTIRPFSLQSNHNPTVTTCYLLYLYPSCRAQWLSSSTESTRNEFTGENAYDLLGVSETSSFAEIKASFRKLAKETHPDLAESENGSSASQRFVQILAAYEILSDSEKRALYDGFLLSQRKFVQKHYRKGSTLYAYESHVTMVRQMEVVEWLKWYRFAINNILMEKRVVTGSGYFDVLEAEFYSVIHRAFYGPIIESWELLPDRFEAEERSVCGTPEVLHLVSGRDLFGMVCLVNKHPELSHAFNEKLTSSASVGSGMCQYVQNASYGIDPDVVDNVGNSQMWAKSYKYYSSDAYKDLELHLSGRVVAVATRLPPKSFCDGSLNEDSQDHIHVFLNSHEDPVYINKEVSEDSFSGAAVGSRIPLGKIIGLGTNPEEESCFVYNNSGTKTHMIMKHRTLLVKHMHWFHLGDRVSVCECRCSRARLPPSKFWLFEPRCGMHDIGGWYVETFGRDKKGWATPSRRYWDGFDANGAAEGRLHPAMYLLALAYRTLDLEEAERQKRTIRCIVEGKLFRILSWCKKLF